MADFIKVTHRMSIAVSPYETDVERWISKYQITHMEDDRAHNQSLIIHNGQEMYIRETIDQVIAAFQA